MLSICMELEFAKYDKNVMLQKFHLKNDADYLFLRFVGRDYRIHRATDFMHFETIAFATGHLIERLKECMEEEADAGMN